MGVRVAASPEVLDVFVDGADRLWGFRSRLEIPMGRVRRARVASSADMKRDLRLRTGGLGFPGLAAVGHFRGRESRKQWWRVYRADEVVVVDLSADSLFDRWCCRSTTLPQSSPRSRRRGSPVVTRSR